MLLFEWECFQQTWRREQSLTMFDAASRRTFDTVWFWSLDRFSREGVYETLQYLQRFHGLRRGYLSFTEQYLDFCGLFKDAMISILTMIAKQKRVRMSKQTVAALQRAKPQGHIKNKRCDCRPGQSARTTELRPSRGTDGGSEGLSTTIVAVWWRNEPKQGPRRDQSFRPSSWILSCACASSRSAQKRGAAIGTSPCCID